MVVVGRQGPIVAAPATRTETVEDVVAGREVVPRRRPLVGVPEMEVKRPVAVVTSVGVVPGVKAFLGQDQGRHEEGPRRRPSDTPDAVDEVPGQVVGVAPRPSSVAKVAKVGGLAPRLVVGEVVVVTETVVTATRKVAQGPSPVAGLVLVGPALGVALGRGGRPAPVATPPAQGLEVAVVETGETPETRRLGMEAVDAVANGVRARPDTPPVPPGRRPERLVTDGRPVT